jgi:hypothetical protein
LQIQCYACPAQVKAAYELLDSFHHGSVDGRPSVTALLEEAEQLRRQQDLFELFVSDYVYLQRCTVRHALGGAAAPRLLRLSSSALILAHSTACSLSPSLTPADPRLPSFC